MKHIFLTTLAAASMLVSLTSFASGTQPGIKLTDSITNPAVIRAGLTKYLSQSLATDCSKADVNNAINSVYQTPDKRIALSVKCSNKINQILAKLSFNKILPVDVVCTTIAAFERSTYNPQDASLTVLNMPFTFTSQLSPELKNKCFSNPSTKILTRECLSFLSGMGYLLPEQLTITSSTAVSQDLSNKALVCALYDVISPPNGTFNRIYVYPTTMTKAVKQKMLKDVLNTNNN